jgi:hypothetical protein
VPPGFDREVSVVGDQVTCVLTAVNDGLVDPDHPGWCGSLSRGATGLVVGTAGGLGYDPAGLTIEVDEPKIVIDFGVQTAAPDRGEPDVVALSRFGQTASWTFELTDA